MFSAVKFARAARPSVTGFLRYCSAQVGSKEYFDKLVGKNKVVIFMKVSLKGTYSKLVYMYLGVQVVFIRKTLTRRHVF